MPEAFDFLLIKAFHLEILRYSGQKYMIFCRKKFRRRVRHPMARPDQPNKISSQTTITFANDIITAALPTSLARLASR
jgi:hypothetical protein